MSLEKALENFRKHKKQHLEELKKLVRIPSISFPGFDMQQVVKSAEAVADLLKRVGLENVRLIYAKNNPRPYVYGDYVKDKTKPTLLLYAHHDVQPVGNEELWETPPFEPTERDGRLYARGAADDKAGVVVHTATIASWLEATGDLPVNIKIVVEGEEEVGSPGLADFLKENKELVQADFLVLTDTENYNSERAGLTTALRGIVPIEVEVSALEQSVHSGMWGGPIPDPTMALCKMLATLVDEKGNIAITGINEKVRALNTTQKNNLASLNETEKEFREQSGLLDGVSLLGNPKEIKEKIWFKPSITINAFEASNRKNAANIITASAWAKVSVRIVPDLDPEDVLKKLTNHLEKNCPWGLKVKITPEGNGNWWTTATDHPIFAVAQKAMKEAWGTEPVLMGCGGTIPFVQPFSDALGGAPALLIGVEDPYTKAHSENESLHLGVWEKSVESCIRLFGYAREVKR